MRRATERETVTETGKRGFLLGGKERREGECAAIRSPWDQSEVGSVAVASRAKAIEAAALAGQAFAVTRAMPSHRRQRILATVSERLAAAREDFAGTIVAEAGKPVRAALAEVDRAIFTFRVAGEEAVRRGGEVFPLDLLPGAEGRWGMVRRFPVGPVLAITPFNFPLNLAAHKLAPAIAAGCPVLLKPAPQTPFSALNLARLILEAGWPEEALAVLPLANEDAGWLVEQEERIRLVSFTGSAAVGWRLKARAGRKRVVLELGGNAAMIVHSDWGDLDAVAAKVVAGGFGYAGQSCISVQRLYVERPVFQTLTWKVVDQVGKLAVGDPSNEATDVGPMIRPEEAERAEAWVDEARQQGAKVIAGGSREGSLVQPAVLSGTRPGMKVLDEEAFAPLVVVEPYDDFRAVLREVNRSRYGLQAGLFTRDAGRIFTAYESLDVGAVIVGDAPTWRVDPMPYGGVKESGEGREGLRYAIEGMTEPKLLAMAL